jgi:hypothetical protein
MAIMRRQRFWLYRRSGIFYLHDSETGARDSLKTRDKREAQRIRTARNEVAEQPALGLRLASAYLTACDPRMVQRTWSIVMDEFCAKGRDSTKIRRQRAMRNRSFDLIRNII